jgi:serine/threonine protein kinase
MATSQVGTPLYAAPEVGVGCVRARTTAPPVAAPHRGTAVGTTGNEANGGGGVLGSGLSGGVINAGSGGVAGEPSTEPDDVSSAAGLQFAYGAKADVWSLGVLAFELLTGVVPFRGTNPQDQWRVATTQVTVMGLFGWAEKSYRNCRNRREWGGALLKYPVKRTAYSCCYGLITERAGGAPRRSTAASLGYWAAARHLARGPRPPLRAG